MNSKPYIIGSKYLIKMSIYKNGRWQNVWDGLFLLKPRLGMLVRMFDKTPEETQQKNLENGRLYLT
jgi:deoxyribodipyrimidine photolyase-related protein